jgi:hypothetical protein
MAIYVLNIDERSVRGRAFKTLLEQESAAKLLTMDEYDKAESDALMAKMGESAEEGLLSYEEAKAEFKRLRKRLAK